MRGSFIRRLAVVVSIALIVVVSGLRGAYIAQEPVRTFATLAPGVEYLQLSQNENSATKTVGPWVTNLLRIDLTRVELRIVHALDEAVGLETTSSMASRYDAIAAINAGYFRTTGTYRGDSEGVLKLAGRILSEPNKNRAAIGLSRHRDRQTIVFGHLGFRGSVRVGGKRELAINGINRPRNDNETVLYAPEFHRSTLTNPVGVEVIVRGGIVREVRDGQGSSSIPSDGFVLSFSGTAREWARKNLDRGARVRVELRLEPVEKESREVWSSVTEIVGGGPQLIRDGRIDITNASEGIANAFVSDRHPRTAIGKLRDGKLLLVTVDGRQPGVSVGMSLPELATFMLSFGVVEAINLDGGGSTTMISGGKVVNKPSDQTGERPVSDAILVIPRIRTPRN